MRIIQIIDSLEAGGAERMAVSYANSLAKKIAFSGLVVTRKEGPLVHQIDAGVSYLYLDKKGVLDLKALFRLRKYVKDHHVAMVQAHSTSFFLAFFLRLICPSVRLIWHDHYGDSEFLAERPRFVLRLVIPFFSGIIAVNQKLKVWSEQQLHFKNTLYLPNFPSEENTVLEQTLLSGVAGKRIVCLANLRAQKDHFLLLEVAKKVQQTHPDWSFHLVGKDFNDGYSQKIKDLVVAYHLEKNVFLYGSKEDVSHILNQSAIAILTSQSEGLPVALLEYGWHKKPVIVTDVGEVSSLIISGENGFIVASQQVELFYDALVALIVDESLRVRFGEKLYQSVVLNHSEKAVVEKYLNWCAK
jgi:glycosyltransferase involved in cell wall biosynthesis